jgi:hypothetical protein
MSEKINDGGHEAKISYLPIHSGDGYGFGGGVILTLDDLSFNFGEGPRAKKIAEEIVRRWNIANTASAPAPLAELAAMLDMFEQRPDMMRAIRPLMGPAEIVIFEAARAAISKAGGASS